MKSDSLQNRVKGFLWNSSSLNSTALLFLFPTCSGWLIARCFANASWQFCYGCLHEFWTIMESYTCFTVQNMCDFSVQTPAEFYMEGPRTEKFSHLNCLFVCSCVAFFPYQLFACCGVWRVRGRTVRCHLSDTRALSSVSSERDQHLPMFPLLTNCQE